MKLLEERILKDGRVIGKDVLKIDSFLNQQIDLNLLEEIGKAFHEAFSDIPLTKILTIEASGISVAVMTAREFNNCPVLFAKKDFSRIMVDDVYVAPIHSFTKGLDYHAIVSKRFLSKDDHILIIDDFLGNGDAVAGLIKICRQAGATVEGVGIVIEKSFMRGIDRIENKGVRVVSLARIASLKDGKIHFMEED
ncbi:MAG: xanthine phosphoribosyltransferase [Erysipelotrichaceae bacterium]|nr:xanthine phosphoribosyltransferase [Erysipelotrichaceae bacterium]